MVSIGRVNAQVASAAAATAIKIPGQLGRNRRSTTMRTMLAAATAIAGMLAVGSACANAFSFGTNSPGSFPARVIPSRSLSWLARMMTAMPAVNPTVTG